MYGVCGNSRYMYFFRYISDFQYLWLFCFWWITSEHMSRVSRTSLHYDDVIMGANASQITSLTIVYSTVYSDGDQRKHQCSASLAFVWGIHRGPVNSPHKWPVTRKMFPFHDVIMRASHSSSRTVVTMVVVVAAVAVIFHDDVIKWK